MDNNLTPIADNFSFFMSEIINLIIEVIPFMFFILPIFFILKSVFVSTTNHLSNDNYYDNISLKKEKPNPLFK